eukprot:gb/GECH01009178.1/.p1 GENE.gb/GECH01009178.1/~~gb/GECH01009178.1/.p1  ORF type:complete len:418 (+),score=39.84 gb/GECH01009178.1/:1-1254(+)
MTLFSVPLLIRICVVYTVLRFSKYIFYVEKLFNGLEVLLPQIKPTPTGHKRESYSREIYVRLEQLKEKFLRTLYFYSDFEFAITSTILLLINYFLGIIFAIVKPEKYPLNQDIFTFCFIIAVILISCYSLLKTNFKKDKRSTERVLSLAFSLFSFIVALTFTRQDSALDLNLNSAYFNLKHLVENEYLILLPENSKFFKLIISVLSAIISGIVFTASIRWTRCHIHLNDKLSVLAYPSWLRFGSWINLALPLLATFVFLKPTSFTLFANFEKSKVEKLRLLLLLMVVLVRIPFIRMYVQVHVFSAFSTVVATGSVEQRLSVLKLHAMRYLKFVILAMIQIVCPVLLLLAFVILIHLQTGYFMPSQTSGTIPDDLNPIAMFYQTMGFFFGWWISLSLASYQLVSWLYFAIMYNRMPAD